MNKLSFIEILKLTYKWFTFKHRDLVEQCIIDIINIEAEYNQAYFKQQYHMRLSNGEREVLMLLANSLFGRDYIYADTGSGSDMNYVIWEKVRKKIPEFAFVNWKYVKAK